MDKIKGALYGVAIADALGGPLEFMSRDEIKRVHGEVTQMIGGGWLSLTPGETTDDTAMTLAVANGIIDDYLNPIPYIGKRFIDWINTRPKDVGMTCKLVIEKAKEMNVVTFEDWFNLSRSYDKYTNGKSAGNGALMRTIYPGLFYPKDIAVDVAKDIGTMTHYSELSSICIECYTKFIADCSNNEATKEDLEEYMIPVRKIALTQTPEPTGFVVDSLILSLNAIKETNNYEDCIIKIINNGGDADTIAAIAGGLLGCIYGYSSIPKRWIDVLDVNVKNELDKLSNIVINRRVLFDKTKKEMSINK